MNKLLDAALALWVDETRKALGEDVCKLIRQANYDLHYGPVGDGAYRNPAEDEDDDWKGWPGFEKACDALKEAFSDRAIVPSQLYFDVDCDMWQTEEPEPQKCETCEGEGKFDWYNEASDEVEEVEPCPDCRGDGNLGILGEWYRVERRELIRALVGRELAQYV